MKLSSSVLTTTLAATEQPIILEVPIYEFSMTDPQHNVPPLAEMAGTTDSAHDESEDVILAESIPRPAAPTRPSNKLGVVGIVLALISLLMLGFLGPVAVIVSAIAMQKKPKEIALAGFIIGAFATSTFVWSLVFGIALLSTVSTMSNQTTNWLAASQTRMTLQTDAFSIGQLWKKNEKLPTQAEGDKMVAASVDDWANAIHYEVEGNSFRLRSYGADETPDTLDDIIVGPFYDDDEISQF